jgi:phospholipase C
LEKIARKSRVVVAVTASLLQFSVVNLAFADSARNHYYQDNYSATVTNQPYPTSDVQEYLTDPRREPNLSPNEIARLLRKKIKYVFVLFNENRSFDNEYGTLPGANGLYADSNGPRSVANTPGFTQTYTGPNGPVTVQPFLIGPQQNASSIDSVDHSHTGLATKIDVVNGVPQMDKFAYDEYNRFASKGGTANIAEGTQYARLVMSHIDCNTVPFFWKWATRFTIFDNIFATEDTPSTPNAIAMIAGQSGETQWVEHPGPKGGFTPGNTYSVANAVEQSTQYQAYPPGAHTGTTNGTPIVNDPQPFYGSQFDTTPVNEDRQPAGTDDGYADTNIASILTFASLPLTFQGSNIKTVLKGDRNPTADLPDIQQDIKYIHDLGTQPVNWRWYQEGYDLESTDTTGVASHEAYISHHNGPQYFGYVSNTPSVSNSLRGLTDFFNDIANNNLPKGGVFYIRGGYTNQKGLLPPITEPNLPAAEQSAIEATYLGDDDHAGYSDSQISEAMNARVINAIASNPKIWSQSAIIITYDESDGFYDHVPPHILSYGPDGLPLSRGIRIPLLLISPYARTHAVSHVEGDHNAVIQTIEAVFGLPALASLPNEAQALAAGNSPLFDQFGPAGFQQKYLGPRDINSPITESLLSGFDPNRLRGYEPPLPASFAKIPDNVVETLPAYGGNGCQAIGVIPEDQRLGIQNNIPADFNPRPATYKAGN